MRLQAMDLATLKADAVRKGLVHEAATLGLRALLNRLRAVVMEECMQQDSRQQAGAGSSGGFRPASCFTPEAAGARTVPPPNNQGPTADFVPPPESTSSGADEAGPSGRGPGHSQADPVVIPDSPPLAPKPRPERKQSQKQEPLPVEFISG